MNEQPPIYLEDDPPKYPVLTCFTISAIALIAGAAAGWWYGYKDGLAQPKSKPTSIVESVYAHLPSISVFSGMQTLPDGRQLLLNYATFTNHNGTFEPAGNWSGGMSSVQK